MEQDIITAHMWPLTRHFPKYKESYIISFVDKYAACKEASMSIFHKLRLKQMYRYAYLFLALLVIPV